MQRATGMNCSLAFAFRSKKASSFPDVEKADQTSSWRNPAENPAEKQGGTLLKTLLKTLLSNGGTLLKILLKTLL